MPRRSDRDAPGRPTWRIAGRYVLLQLPFLIGIGLALLAAHRWLGVPGWIGWLALVLWAAKDAVLFPFVWRAYHGGASSRSPLLGQTGIAEEDLAPAGYVRVGAELWRAEIAQGSRPVSRGEAVRVCKVEGLTLRVEPAGERACPK